MSEIQRQRILAAMADVASERGAGAVTVAHVVGRAGVSRRTFYDLFEDREQCFLVAFEEAVAQAAQTVVPAWLAAGPSWSARVRAGLTALLWFFDGQPALARLCVVEALAAGPVALERRGLVVAHLVAAVDEGRAEVRKGIEPTPLTADGVVGAVLSVIHSRLCAGEAVGGLLGALMSMIVLPYQGQGAARRELRRPLPALSPHRARRGSVDPLEGLDMRITYRTVRALAVIAAHAGANNRQIAALAGIHDQGQVSKLLARLQHLGLVQNDGDGSAKGAPNAWRLTAKGEQVEQAVQVQTSTS